MSQTFKMIFSPSPLIPPEARSGQVLQRGTSKGNFKCLTSKNKPNNMKLSFLTGLFLLITVNVFSQDYVDVLKVTGITTPYNTFDSSSATTQINELNADLTVPIRIGAKLSIITGAIYENINTKLFADSNVKHFGSATLKLGANKQFGDKWSGTVVLLPKIASDYKSVQSKDLQMGVIGIMKYKKHDNMNYKFGLYYNSELFGPFFVPMAGLYYLSPDKKFETNLMLPLQADANYKVFSFMQAGINFNGQIRSYHLNSIRPELKSTYVARSTNEFFVYLKFNISKNVSLTTRVGQSVGRSYRVYDENDKVDFGLPALFFGGNRKQLNSDFSNGMIGQVTFLYRFNLNE